MPAAHRLCQVVDLGELDEGFDVGSEEGNRLGRVTTLQEEEPVNGGLVGRIGADAVDGLGRDTDDPALGKDLGGIGEVQDSDGALPNTYRVRPVRSSTSRGT